MDDQKSQQPNQPSNSSTVDPNAQLPPITSEEQQVLKEVENLEKEEETEEKADAEVIDQREEKHQQEEKTENASQSPSKPVV